MANQPKITIDDIKNKISQFEDKKRQKIQMMKEEKEQKEIEECKFVPQLITKKKNGDGADKRNLEKFLEDQ